MGFACPSWVKHPYYFCECQRSFGNMWWTSNLVHGCPTFGTQSHMNVVEVIGHSRPPMSTSENIVNTTFQERKLSWIWYLMCGYFRLSERSPSILVSVKFQKCRYENLENNIPKEETWWIANVWTCGCPILSRRPLFGVNAKVIRCCEKLENFKQENIPDSSIWNVMSKHGYKKLSSAIFIMTSVCRWHHSSSYKWKYFLVGGII